MPLPSGTCNMHGVVKEQCDYIYAPSCAFVWLNNRSFLYDSKYARMFRKKIGVPKGVALSIKSSPYLHCC